MDREKQESKSQINITKTQAIDPKTKQLELNLFCEMLA
jgi:hypothetical protein